MDFKRGKKQIKLSKENNKLRFWVINNCVYELVGTWRNTNNSWSVRIKLPYSILETGSRYAECGYNDWYKRFE